jgi:hypothetical protein
MIIFGILLLLVISINLAVLYLISENEKKSCDCSHTLGWKRKFIKYYTQISLALIVILYIIPFLLFVLRLNGIGFKLAQFIKSPIINFLLSVFVAVGFFNIYCIFKYTTELESNKCGCLTSEDNILLDIIRKWLYYYSVAVIVIYILTTLLGVSITLKKR